MSHFIVAQPEKCIGCYTCEVACAVGHEGTPLLAARHYFPRLKVVKSAQISVPVMCRQCENAPCVAACPVAALYKGEQAIETQSQRCINCKSCVIACPFGAIEIVGKNEAVPQIVKCDLCAGQQAGPACVRVCPTGALTLVTAGDLTRQQQKQQRAAAKSQLHAHIPEEVKTHG
ncbi:4Fe-4S dicluster domain-containing protein [Kalamiella sp. sgz302252]|uniref:4Fe-4S dicluster domain-containing protein n=1 Tax=Pantoea sp. sgz302252 TaxID=3341827 RepID=UPI0036D3893D